MENFRRSLRYLWPYRRRIFLAVFFTILIAGLWGGGLGLVLPGAKILLAPEGLHGWVYGTLTQKHLGIQTVEQDPKSAPLGGPPPDFVLNIASVADGSPAAKAGLKPGEWIVGLGGKVTRSKDLLRNLGMAEPGQTVTLSVYDPTERTVRPMPVTIGKEDFTGRLMRRIIVKIPEPANRADRFNLFVGLLVIVLVVTALRGLFTFTQEYLVGSAIQQGIMDLRCENYNAVLHFPTTFFSEKGVSDATSRFIQDTNELARGQDTLLGKTMVEPAKAIGSLVLAIWCSWELTLVALVAGPPAFMLIRRFGKKMHKASKRALESWSAMLAVLNETLIGIRVVKAYTMEGSERRRFFRVNRELLKQQLRKTRLDAATGPTVETLGITAGMFAAAGAAYLVFVGYHWGNRFIRMDEGVFLTWMVALFAMFDPIRKLAKVTMRFNESDAAAKRIFELQDVAPEPQIPNAITLPRHSHTLTFENICYRYPGANVEAVKNVSLEIKAGQSVAIVGPNGSGKTTLVSLVPRLLAPASGKILIDGHDITAVSTRSLRRQIGLVTQDTVLFRASITENIAYGLRRPKQDAVLAASKQAFVDEFVRDMPNGYNTLVGEHGATLSGGQKQRISIARAILRDPSILIFDEAMSQVDSDSEQKIHKAMETFVQGRTTLMIAHRFATVLTADMIVVMAAGCVVDTGTHEELLNRCELYQQLYKTQFTASGG